MSDEAAVPGEPDLSEFEPEQWTFATAAARAEYVAAFEELRQAARDAHVHSLHARLTARPDPNVLRAMARSLREHIDFPAAAGPVWKSEVHAAPEGSVPHAPGAAITDGMVGETVAPGVRFVRGPSVNWVIVDGAYGPVLIDTGYPGDGPAVQASLREVGWAVSNLAAILITHGHGDHIGNAAALAAVAGCPVYAHADELPNIRREILEQVSIRALLPHLFRVGVLKWARHAATAGGHSAPPVPTVLPFPAGGPSWDALGVDVHLVRLPGHTRGHAGYVLPTAGVLVAGDALVTAHPTSPIVGPQLLPSIFHDSPPRAFRTLQNLGAVRAAIVLPGHGPAERRTPADVAARARNAGAAF